VKKNLIQINVDAEKDVVIKLLKKLETITHLSSAIDDTSDVLNVGGTFTFAGEIHTNVVFLVNLFGENDLTAVGKLSINNEEHVRFAFFEGEYEEIETDQYGSFTFPDAGDPHELEYFAARELAGYRQFLEHRAKVHALWSPKLARYSQAIKAVKDLDRELLSYDNEKPMTRLFVDTLRERVAEAQQQERDNNIAYSLIEYLTDNLGDDGVAAVEAAAQYAVEASAE